MCCGKKEKLEMLGFEPRTFCMQSRRSTAELHPQLTPTHSCGGIITGELYLPSRPADLAQAHSWQGGGAGVGVGGRGEVGRLVSMTDGCWEAGTVFASTSILHDDGPAKYTHDFLLTCCTPPY